MAPTAAKKVTKIVVVLERQKLIAFSKDEKLFEFDCVIGREGHKTEPGKFRISRKEEMHLSRKYGNAKMPFSMFFSKDGKAIHGTPMAGVRSFAGWLGLGQVIPAVGSHGCVGLDEDNAKKLYEVTPTHTLVEIIQK